MWQDFFAKVAPDYEKPDRDGGSVIQGDCVEVMRTLPSECVDLVVTDPPYIVNYRDRDDRKVANDDNDEWLGPTFQEAYRLLKRDAFCVSFYGWFKVDRFMAAWLGAGFKPVGQIVWIKEYRSSCKYVHRHHEQAYVLTKGDPRPQFLLNDVQPWHYSGNVLHPTQKSATVIEPLVRAFSEEGDLVLDPFCGSGSTLVAAKRLRRRYLGIELVRQYATIAEQNARRERVLFP